MAADGDGFGHFNAQIGCPLAFEREHGLSGIDNPERPIEYAQNIAEKKLVAECFFVESSSAELQKPIIDVHRAFFGVSLINRTTPEIVNLGTRPSAADDVIARGFVGVFDAVE